jgi:hypothetical protein
VPGGVDEACLEAKHLHEEAQNSPMQITSEIRVTSTVDSRFSARGLTALRLNRGNVFFKKKFIFREYHICLNVLYASQCQFTII